MLLERIDIVTLFPDWFESLSGLGLTGRALAEGSIRMETWNPRDYTRDRHRSVDDRPYGGGPGMVFRPQPLVDAVEAARAAGTDTPVIALSPQGRRLEQKDVADLARRQRLILLCGRYEGIDERAVEAVVDEEWSIGDYVLSGGELAAAVLMDAVIRLQPGILGHEDSAVQDSFSDGLLDCPHYTRPEEFRGAAVPEVLTSGDHGAVARWRRKQSLGRTWLRRPDLLERLTLDDEDRALLEEFQQENSKKTGYN